MTGGKEVCMAAGLATFLLALPARAGSNGVVSAYGVSNYQACCTTTGSGCGTPNKCCDINGK